MVKPKNECIDCRCFAALMLDYEWDGKDGFPAYVSCRVLVEDLKVGEIVADTREKAIEIFRNGAWKR